MTLSSLATGLILALWQTYLPKQRNSLRRNSAQMTMKLPGPRLQLVMPLSCLCVCPHFCSASSLSLGAGSRPRIANIYTPTHTSNAVINVTEGDTRLSTMDKRLLVSFTKSPWCHLWVRLVQETDEVGALPQSISGLPGPRLASKG